MTFTREVERHAIELFLDCYNPERGTKFRVVKHGDAPDFLCADETGATLNVQRLDVSADRNRWR